MFQNHLFSASSATNSTPPDNKGLEFILMFMENERLGAQLFPLELYCTTQEAQAVNVHVTSPKSGSPSVDEHFTVTDGQVHKVIIDGAFRMNGNGIEQKGILITADAEVACYGANKETLSNDVFLGLPVDALGTDYYAMVHSPALVKTEIGLAGTADGTDVTITLPAGNGPLNVTFLGKTYHEGGVIHATLQQYETLQIQSTGDLAGKIVIKCSLIDRTHLSISSLIHNLDNKANASLSRVFVLRCRHSSQ